MELFLNLCWLALVLPGYLLWRQRHFSGHSARSPLLTVGALACVLILLFPVVSVSDDLHVTPQAIEESKRSFHQASPHADSARWIAHVSPLIAPALSSLHISFEQLGAVQLLVPHSPQVLFVSASAGRSPPFAL